MSLDMSHALHPATSQCMHVRRSTAEKTRPVRKLLKRDVYNHISKSPVTTFMWHVFRGEKVKHKYCFLIF